MIGRDLFEFKANLAYIAKSELARITKKYHISTWVNKQQINMKYIINTNFKTNSLIKPEAVQLVRNSFSTLQCCGYWCVATMFNFSNHFK